MQACVGAVHVTAALRRDSILITAGRQRRRRPKPRRALTLAAGFLLFGVACGHPSDRSLAYNFYRNHALFSRLIQMAAAERSVVRIDSKFTCCPTIYADPRVPRDLRSDGRLSNARWENYRALFRQLGLEDGISVLGSKRVAFLASSVGIVNRGSTKGYIYSTVPPSPLVESLDDRSPGPCSVQRDCEVYKHLTGNWYLFFER